MSDFGETASDEVLALDKSDFSQVGRKPISGMDRQNIMRLKVNRIAIVQELKVEHVLEQLRDKNILTDAEKRKIERGTTPSDRARILIDILPTKPKDTEWYKHFRESLLNADANIEFCKRYRDVVEFLDNTVIHRPASQAARFSEIDSKMDVLQFPKYEPLPNIVNAKGVQNTLFFEPANSNSDESGETETEKGTVDESVMSKIEMEDKTSVWSEESRESMTLIKGFFHQWVPMPDNFRSLIEIPREQIKILMNSDLRQDKDLLEAEKKAFQKMRKFEVVAALNRRKRLPLGFELCMCDAFQEILAEPALYHLYLKYFRHINMNGINILRDIINSYASVVEALDLSKITEGTKHVIETGFGIVDVLMEFNCLEEGEEILSGLIRFLDTNSSIDTWVAKYRSFVKLMSLRLKNYDFSGCQQSYFWSIEMTWAIKMMSFGQDLIDESETFVGLSAVMLETGSITPALGWANRALHEVHDTNTSLVLDCLCHGVMVYCAKGQVQKAELLAVQVVQMANLEYGKRHPKYLHALLHFCHFSSEFVHDETGLEAAKECLIVAKRIHSCETVQLAMAHRAVSRSLMVMQQFQTDDYYEHAMEAVRIARTQLPQGHPMLHLFLFTFASALQWKALSSPAEIQGSTLRWAEAEARQALGIVSSSYGEISLKSAQVFGLLGQIYSKMDSLDEAERHLAQSVALMKLCQNPNSNYRLLATATLATFYKIVNKPAKALPLLQHVIENIEPSGVYLQWVHMCYDNLVKVLQASQQNQQAKVVQQQLSDWLKENPTHERKITMETLNQRPPPYKDFLLDFDKWGTSVRKAMKELSI